MSDSEESYPAVDNLLDELNKMPTHVEEFR